MEIRKKSLSLSVTKAFLCPSVIFGIPGTFAKSYAMWIYLPYRFVYEPSSGDLMEVLVSVDGGISLQKRHQKKKMWVGTNFDLILRKVCLRPLYRLIQYRYLFEEWALPNMV